MTVSIAAGEVEAPTLTWLEIEDETSEWQPYEAFDGTTELGVLECHGEVTIAGSVHRSAVYDLEDRHDVSVGDFDIAEDHYAEVELTRRVTLRFNIRVELNTDAEVLHLEDIFAD